MTTIADKNETDIGITGITDEKNNIIQSIFRAAPVGIGMVVDRIIK
jgi:hypothetical protein